MRRQGRATLDHPCRLPQCTMRVQARWPYEHIHGLYVHTFCLACSHTQSIAVALRAAGVEESVSYGYGEEGRSGIGKRSLPSSSMTIWYVLGSSLYSCANHSDLFCLAMPDAGRWAEAERLQRGAAVTWASLFANPVMGVPSWVPLQVFGNSRSLNPRWRACVVQVRSSTRLPPLLHDHRLLPATSPFGHTPHSVILQSLLSRYPSICLHLSLRMAGSISLSRPRPSRPLLPQRHPPIPLLVRPKPRVRPPAHALAHPATRRISIRAWKLHRDLSVVPDARLDPRLVSRRRLKSLTKTDTAGYSVVWTARRHTTASLHSQTSTMGSRRPARSSILDTASFGEFQSAPLVPVLPLH